MSGPSDILSAAEARWLAIQAQGLGRPRPSRPAGRPRLSSTIAQLGTIQLDAINVVQRTQFVVLFSRLGPYDNDHLHRLTGPGGGLFEYWGHAASLLPMDHQPLFRWRMRQFEDGRTPARAAARQAFRRAHGDYIASILEEIRARGPLAASQLSDPRPQQGEWWGRRSLGRRALEFLFATGTVAAWRTPSFERVYDLPERVIPSAILNTPTPDIDEAQRQLLLQAARSLGAATAGDLAGYYMLTQREAKPRLAELVEQGDLQPVAVEGWREAAYIVAGSNPTRPRRVTATLLSPFDSLIWDRDRNRRLFGFDYRIEVYVPEPDRQHGYYVLPLLLADRLVAGDRPDVPGRSHPGGRPRAGP